MAIREPSVYVFINVDDWVGFHLMPMSKSLPNTQTNLVDVDDVDIRADEQDK